MSDASTSNRTSPSLLARLRDHAASAGEHPVYIEIGTDGQAGRSLTYGQLLRHVDAAAARLSRRVPPASVVLICCPNTIEFPIAFLATLAAGCVAFPVSADSADAELAKAARSADVAAVIGINRALGALADVHLTSIALPELHGDDADPTSLAPPSRYGLLLQSSGTTGRPKIAFRSGDSVDAVAEQMVRAIGFRGDDRVLSTIPLCHSYGLEHGLLAPLFAGSTVHLSPGFNFPIVLQELSAGGITILPGVPSIYEMLAQIALDGTCFPNLRAAYSAGAGLPRVVYDAFCAKFGIRVGQLYGATEIGSVTYANVHDPAFDPASVGRGMAHVEIRVCKIDDAAVPIPIGAEGQVCIRARSMLSRYLGEDASPFVDGYFPTADLGRLDDRGNLTITGRLKLLIDVGGLKVNPIEVEDVLLQHPAVSGCVIVPVRQSQTVFRLKAIITARDPSRPPATDELRAFARRRLTGHKVPRLFEIRDTLPRTPTGKVLRHLVEA